MNESRDIKSQESGEVQSAAEQAVYMRPAVDIYEDAQGITLKADLPGVSPERLEIQVDKDTLLIEAQASLDMPEGMEAQYADVRSTHFRRSFTLSRELATDRINAQMNDGVLILSVPKRAELQPRKIEVSAG